MKVIGISPQRRNFLRKAAVAVPVAAAIGAIGTAGTVWWSSNFGHNDRFTCCHFPFVDGGRQIAQC